MQPKKLFSVISFLGLCTFAFWELGSFAFAADSSDQAAGAVGKPPANASADPAAASDVELLRYTNVRTLPDDVTVAVLSNGLTAIVQENHVAPVATVRCFVKNTGSAFEGKYLGAGISHVLEHVVAGGSTARRTEKEIERLVNTFGGATNAFTSIDMTTFFIDCPAKNTLEAIDLLADAMQHVKFEPSEFNRELKVVKRELADDEVSRQHVIWNMLNETVYLSHPSRHPIIGYLDVLNRTTNQTIIDFYHDRYVPNNQVFVVVGDVKTQEVLDTVAKQFSGTTRSYETYIAMEDEPLQLSPREAIREMDGATCDMVFAWPTVKLSDPDMYALDVAAYILGQGESSRLTQHLKYEKQLLLSVQSASNTPNYVAGYFAIFASSRPETWQPASEEILREVYRLCDELVEPESLAKAKKQKASEVVYARQTVQDVADALGRDFISAGDPLYEKSYADNIQKVTAEQIREVARKYFTPQRLNRVMIAPPGVVQKTAASEKSDGQNEIREVRLPNGLRVLLKRHSQLPMISMQAFVLAGSLADNDETSGRASLVASMLDMGTTEHSAEQIADYYDSIGGHIGMHAGRFTIYGGVSTLRDDFPQAAALFAECFLHPTFPQEEYAKMQQLMLGAIAARADDPHQEINELFCDQLPVGSPYRLVPGGKADVVRKLTVKDLREYHAKYFVPNNMIVAVFGDIEPDAALTIVKNTFGALKPAQDFKPLSFDRSNAIPKSVVRHQKVEKETGMVMLGMRAPSILEKEDHAAMVLLSAVMAGYRYPGGWLHNELRGEGLVYSVHATQLTGPVPGFFVVIAQTEPSKVAEVVGRIRKNIARAKEGNIPEDEFQTAKQRVLALHAQEGTTIDAQALEAATDELYGLGYDYRKTFDARIEAVTLADLVRVAKKYFGNEVLVSLSPKETE
jgi:zinc protease